ncbi:vitamin K epoxide reductase family protein [Candidatus Woesearchaeota archaeon]|nr:vitamin K epoxide reductase family protein [Candidatus Woesearchaeota archaeon]
MPYPLYLQLLSASGFLISLYFAFTYHGFTKPSNKLIPADICSENMCHSILNTKFASVFKIPNFYLGLIYYFIVFLSGFFVLNNLILLIFVIVAWLVVLFSIYLAYALIFKLRTACNLCFTAQIINLAIAVLYSLMI